MEKILNAQDIKAMDRNQRRNFINTLSGIKNAQLLGTQSPAKIDNLGLFSSVVHIGAAPPCLGFMMRPLTVHRQSYNNLKANGHFTLNQVHHGIVEQGHQTSAKYPADSSEFVATGLSPQRTATLQAPYVQEAHIKIGLEFYEEHYIQANHSWLIVGKIIEVLLPEGSVEADGHIDTANWGGIGVSGLDTYYNLEKKLRLPYARVK